MGGLMAAAITVDVAGGPMGGAARFRGELYRYLERAARQDVQVIGAQRRVDPVWLLRRELAAPIKGRRVALNNVGFIAPGGERWTLLRNALHFLTKDEESHLPLSVITAVDKTKSVVRLAARRSDVLVTPCSSMAERVESIIPSVRRRIVVRPHPVSPDTIVTLRRDPAILCPVLFAPYKQMTDRLSELLASMDEYGDPSIRVRVTAEPAELPQSVASHSKIELVGRLDHAALRHLWASSRAIYYPTGIESFGYPLAEARVLGQPVIARDTEQNREIAGRALCGFTQGDAPSLQSAIKLALTTEVEPDPAPFDPDAYFNWLLGSSQ
jgi:glycosyltransferase involved in cell wall biosynthesis